MDFGRGMLDHWMLDPAVTYLNHGTVGAIPRRVLAAQQAIREEIERQPAAFLLRDLVSLAGARRAEPGRMRRAADAVAAFVGAGGDDLVFVDNATTGINAVLHSFDLRPGDEILLCDHTYGAILKAAGFVARERGAHARTFALPYPEFRIPRLLAAVEEALTPRTRLLVIDHITSESALVLPVAEVAALCRKRGVRVLVDGAHAPGVLPLDLPALGVDWYVANLHKWAHAPRSCGFLWAAPGAPGPIHPPVISWGLDQGWLAEFDWVGTRDPSPWLAAPAGIAFLAELGFERVRGYGHALAWESARLLTSAWGTSLWLEESSVGSMVTVPAPSGVGGTRADAARLRDALLFEDHIEVQVHATGGQVFVRVSAPVYVERADVEKLAAAVLARA